MNKRIELAIATLKAGGYFRYSLERTYMGYEQFATRLISSSGEIVKGIGFNSLLDLRNSNIVERDFSEHYGSSACEIYRLSSSVRV